MDEGDKEVREDTKVVVKCVEDPLYLLNFLIKLGTGIQSNIKSLNTEVTSKGNGLTVKISVKGRPKKRIRIG